MTGPNGDPGSAPDPEPDPDSDRPRHESDPAFENRVPDFDLGQQPADAVGHDGVQYLSGSPARVAILRALREQPRRPAGLTAAIDATRTTVQRILGGFRDRNWVIKRDGSYHVTSTGIRVHDAYEHLLSEVACAETYGAFVAEIERVATGFPAAGLEDGRLTVADDSDPLAAVDRVVELITETGGSSVRAVSPIVTQRYNEAAANALNAGARIELLIDESVLSASVSDFQPETSRALEDDAAMVRVTALPIEFGLFLADAKVAVVAHDDRNSPWCVFESTEPAVIEWATVRYEELRSTAIPIDQAIKSIQ